jgi:hypothetical protein
MECPGCKLTNPDSTQRCDCGYNFLSRKLEEPLLPPKAPKSGMGRGLTTLLCLAAVILLIALWFPGWFLFLIFMLVRVITGRDVL